VSGYVIAIRARGSVDDALPAVRSTLQRLWGPDLPAWHFSLLRDAWHEGLTPFRGKALLVSLVGGFCVPLAAIGLMGALLYSVRVRTREIAIRIALGAVPAAVKRSVVARSLMIVGTGLALGSALGFAAGRAASHQLFNVSPADPWTLAAVAAGLLTLSWVAALMPAAHAARTEPANALRHE
jgi:putative ABC transport system permease protein